MKNFILTITFEETLRFERVPEKTYQAYSYEIVPVQPGSLTDRVAAIKAALLLWESNGL